MILTFIERLGRVTNLCKDRGQAYTRNAFSSDECGVFWQDGVSPATTRFNTSFVEEAILAKALNFSPAFSHVRQRMSFARGLASCTKWDTGEGAPPAPRLVGRLCSDVLPSRAHTAVVQRRSRPASLSTRRAAICGRAGCGYTAREATTP